MSDTGSTLILDTSGPVCFCGIQSWGEWNAFATSEGMALEALFEQIESVFAKSGARLESLDRIVYCRGPGSILGLRVALMALRTWRAIEILQNTRLQSYRSFDLATAQLFDEETTPPFTIVSPFRRDRWLRMEVLTEEIDTTRSIEACESVETTPGSPPIFTLVQRKLFADRAPGTLLEPSWTAQSPWFAADSPLQRDETGSLDLEMIEQPQFALWSGQRHTAPQANG